MDDKCGSDLISLKELVLLSLTLIRSSSLNVVNPQLKEKTKDFRSCSDHKLF